MPQITVSPSQTQFTTQANESILSAALRSGINLPHSCQSGVCGSCAAQVLSGSTQAIDEYDDYVLTPEQIAAGTILLCCTQATDDVNINMPAYAGSHATTIRTLPARLSQVEIRGDVAIIKVALPKSPPFQFFAGQYMEILLKDGTRCYSIANSPSQNDVLEFHVRHHEGGLFSPQLFSGSLKKGAIMRVRGPLGGFYLRESDSDKPLILMATGTGFAPIKSILSKLAEQNSTRPIHVYHGTRYADGLYDETELNQILKQLPNAQYTPVLSRPKPEWTGATGHITEHVLRDYPNLSQHAVYACGSPDMIRDSLALLTQHADLPSEFFYSDVFTPHL